MWIEQNNYTKQQTENPNQQTEIDEQKYKKWITKIQNLEKKDKNEEPDIDFETNIKLKLATWTLEVSDIQNILEDISIEEFLKEIKWTRFDDLIKRRPEIKDQIINTKKMELNHIIYYYMERSTDNVGLILDKTNNSVSHEWGIPKEEKIGILQHFVNSLNNEIRINKK